MSRHQIAVAQPLPNHPINNQLHLVEGVARALVVAPGELGHVAVQVLLAHVVVGAVVSTLENRPEALDSLGVCHPVNELADAVLAYVLPALPFIRFLFGILGWILNVVVAVLAVTVFAAAHITREDGNRLTTQVTRQGWLFLPALILRPPLMLLGLILGYFVFLAGIGLFNQVWLPQMRDAAASGGLGPVGFLAMLALYVIVAYGLMNASFKLIDLLPSAVLDWIGGRAGAGDDASERTGSAAVGGISRGGGAPYRRPRPARRRVRGRLIVPRPACIP